MAPMLAWGGLKRLNSVIANSLLSLGAVLLTLALAEGFGRLLSRAAPRHLHPCLWCRQLRPLLTEEFSTPTGAELPEPEVSALPSGAPSPIPRNEEVTWAVQTQPEDYIVNDPAGYIRPHPGRTYVATRRRKNGDLIYQARYTIDAFGRRANPRDSAARERFLLLLGCSYVFGEGLDDEATLPAQISALDSSYRPYNYGFHGYGPGSVYLRLKNTNLRREVPESRGIAAYFFLNDHLNRMLGSMSLVSTWGAYLPEVEVSSSGELEFHGSFERARPILTPLSQFLGGSSLLRYFAVDFPPVLSDEKKRLFGRIVRGMKEQIRAQLGLDDFYVVFYPGAETAKLLVPELTRQGIRSLDLSDWDMEHLTQGASEIPWDGHPSAAYNRVLAEALTSYWRDERKAR